MQFALLILQFAYRPPGHGFGASLSGGILPVSMPMRPSKPLEIGDRLCCYGGGPADSP